jgi:UDP-arabinose 4-epimerase
MNKTILVTGGAGYIGSHTCKALALSGYTPITYDNLVFGNRWAVRWGALEVGDLNDYTRLNDVISYYRPDAIMHFASYAYVGESVLHPSKYYRNNVVGTLTLLDVMRENAINKIIFSSTCATYGVPDSVPIVEEHPQRPINPYGASKLMIERILKDFESAYGMQSVILRYFNAAGADPDGEIGEAHDPETHLIPLILDVAAGNSPAITVYGDDYNTPDGTCIRDYIHVSDLAQAHLLALQSLNNTGVSAAYNLGNAKGFSVNEVIAAAERVTERTIARKIGKRRDGDPSNLVGDASLAQKNLEWSPRFTDIEHIISSAWRWKNLIMNRNT